MHPDLIKTDGHGQLRHPRSFTVDAEINGFLDGEGFAIRYYKTSNQTRDGVVYSPASVVFDAMRKEYPARDYEEFIFLMLSERCDGGPLQNPDSAPFWRLYEPDKAAAQKLDSFMLKASMFKEILEMPDDLLLARARGIRVGNMELSGEQLENPNQARLALSNMLEGNAPAFVKAWNDSMTVLRGKLAEAIRKGWIVQQPNGGKMLWRWGQQDFLYSGQTITVVDRGQPPFESLVDYVAQVQNKDVVLTHLEEVERRANNPGVQSKKVFEPVFSGDVKKQDVRETGGYKNQELVEKALELSVIKFNEERGIVVWNNGLDAFVPVESEFDWKVQLGNFIAEDKPFAQKLRGTVMGRENQLKRESKK